MKIKLGLKKPALPREDFDTREAPTALDPGESVSPPDRTMKAGEPITPAPNTLADAPIQSNSPMTEEVSRGIHEEIDPSFFTVNFDINGKAFRVAVDHILRIQSEHTDELSIQEIDKQLESCSYYRFSFFAAMQQVLDLRLAKEREYKRWMAERLDYHRRELAMSRKAEREEGQLMAKDQTNITQGDILNTLIVHPEDGILYDRFETQIADLRSKEALLMEVRDALHDRGFALNGIADRLTQLRKKQEF